MCDNDGIGTRFI